jgi:quinol monooxygenase YgiN
MVIRLVKLTFKPHAVSDFLRLFEQHKHAIRNAPGCIHLDLLQDAHQPHVFFTYSHWNNAADLEAYRMSETFSIVWPQTKALFLAPAEAWSVNNTHAFERTFS